MLSQNLENMNLHVEHLLEQELLICKQADTVLKYRVFQIYGQKFVKIMDSERTPERTTEVYAANVPRHMAIEDVFKFFVRCGEIHQLRLLMDYSGTNRGQCFVQYYQLVEARRAVCCLHREYIGDGRYVTIKLSLDNSQLLLRNIPGFISQNHLEAILRRIIGEGLCDLQLRPSRVPFRNWCFCTYRDHQFAILAHKKAWPFINIAGFMVEVQWALPELLKYAVNLYFTNFPPNLSKEELFQLLCEKIDIKSLIQFRFSLIYGYMTFVNAASMENAESALHDLTIRGFTFRFSRTPFPVKSQDQTSFRRCDSRMYHQFAAPSPPRPPIPQPAPRAAQVAPPFLAHPPPPLRNIPPGFGLQFMHPRRERINWTINITNQQLHVVRFLPRTRMAQSQN